MVLYIAGDNRSGTTLLEFLIAGHSKVCAVGELRNMRAYLHQDRKLFDPVYDLVCSCSQPIDECPFWTEVEKELGEPLTSLQLNFAFSRKRPVRTYCDRIRRTLERKAKNGYAHFFAHPKLQRVFRYQEPAGDCFRLYDAVANVSECSIITDSSKLPLRYSCLKNQAPEKVRLIVMVRNPLAVAWSKIKRGDDESRAARDWVSIYQQIAAYTRHTPQHEMLDGQI